METHISQNIPLTKAVQEAESILRNCVHCGFCTATCPTYQLLGDELDSPRGRIYLIKQMLEMGQASHKTRLHLDRCLGCRACETTCPSGVSYAKLLHFGRDLAEQLAPRSLTQKGLRKAFKVLLPYPGRIKPLVRSAQVLRPLLPGSLKQKIPAPIAKSIKPTVKHVRKVILFQGCVQSVLAGSINAATQRILHRLQIQVLESGGEMCCGAVVHHLGDSNKARRQARNNLDLWLPLLKGDAEALVVTASACALEIQEYPQLFAEDEEYHEKSLQIQPYVQEVSDFIRNQQLSHIKLKQDKPVLSFHAPCTLQHGLKKPGQTEQLLRELGFDVREPEDHHLCCGSAGTYSITQPLLSKQLRVNKLQHLENAGGEVIASANIGCLLHLQSGTSRPIKHWVEWLDEYAET